MWRLLLYLILIILLVIIQVAILDSFSLWWININLLLIFLVILVNLTTIRNVFIFTILAGLLMDIYSSLPFATYLIIFFFSAVILEFLFFNFFTNRSIYSLLSLELIAIIIYHLLLTVLVGLYYLFGASEFIVIKDYLGAIIVEILWAIIILLSFFGLINRLSKYFKPIFLSQ